MKRKSFIGNKTNDKNDNLYTEKHLTEYRVIRVNCLHCPFYSSLVLYLGLTTNNLLSVELKLLDRAWKKHFYADVI